MATTDDLKILSESPETYKTVLGTFRECYNLCCRSSRSILSVSVKKEIEQCGVDFRYICEQTAKLAERINSSFIEDSILFFGNEEAMKSKELAQAIAGQAAELANGFENIYKWVQNLAGRCNGCVQDIGSEEDVHLENITKAFEEAKLKQHQASVDRDTAIKTASEAADTQFAWGIASWIPIVNIVAIPMYFVSRSATKQAEIEKCKAQETASTSETKFTSADCERKKAQEAANKLGELLVILTKIESICEGQIAFWRYQSDKFASFGVSIRKYDKMKILHLKAKPLLDWLGERKGMMESYYRVMQQVISGANIATSLEPTKFQSVKLEELRLTLGSA